MCGILGVVQGRGFTVNDAEFAAGLNAIRHRGPDDDAIIRDGPVWFGHRRLSIIDLSPAGRQPMWSACGRYLITYNGEIYNHQALRAEIDASGAAPRWRGESDTEVLLELIARHGVEAALDKVEGMFAFAVWDKSENRFWLARDRFGEKPLYYAFRGEGLAFASELGALEPMTGLDLRVSRESTAAYFSCGYVPAPLSMYQDVFKLAPGCLLRWRPGEAAVIRSYWSLDDMVAEAVAEQGRAVTMAEAVDELDRLVLAATAERMVADVPVGVFLSGGIDSSLIASAMQRCASRPVTTLTLGFEDPRFNEAEHARAVAAHLGTEHIEEIVTPAHARDVVAKLDRMYDEPLADPSQIPTFLLCEMARRHVTVALSGDGGDEAFAGYRRHFATPALWRRIKRAPMRGAMPALINAAPDPVLDVGFSFMGGFARRYGAGGGVAQTMRRVAPWLDARSLLDLHEASLYKWPRAEHVVLGAAYPARDAAPAWSAALGEIDALCVHDMRHYLPGDILTKVDRASMAVSLETRIPLLDPSIARFALGLPLELRLQDATGKLVLRELLKRYVPEGLFNRPKAGFAPPLEAWLLGPLRDWAEDLLAPERLSYGLLDKQKVRAFWERYKKGGTMEEARIWAVLQLQAWRAARGYREPA